ncbi:MAG: serpin family protein [Chlamydiae bacterium]|nr:serpin family protein [Chlamydiota bacterium]
MSISQIGNYLYTTTSNSISYLISRLPSKYKILGAFAVLIIVKVALDKLRGRGNTEQNVKITEKSSLVEKKNIVTISKTKELTQDEMANFSKKVNLFSMKVYQNYAKKDDNFIFFIPNLVAIFSMIYSIAPQDLKEIFAKEFQLDDQFTEEKWHRALQQLNDSLMKRSSYAANKLTYDASNAIAIKNDTQLKPDAYRTVMQYQPEVFCFNTAKEIEQTANQWIKEKTQGKIQDLVKDLDPNTVFMLITTAIFGGKFLHAFDKGKTEKANFFNANGTKTSVDMMFMRSDYIRYGELKLQLHKDTETTLEILELPFHGHIAMIIVKPRVLKYHTGTYDFETKMNPVMEEKNFQKLINYIDSPDFKLRRAFPIEVPKFTSKHEIILTDLKDWEFITQIKNANFAGSFATKKILRGIDEIVSRTIFEMKEDGVTVVGACTATMKSSDCCKINGPFLYFFYDQQTNTILGSGRVLNL